MATTEELRLAARRFAKRFIYRTWPGFCTVCDKRVRFLVLGPWYRDQLQCDTCFSRPRERALMRTIEILYPNWRDLEIHESSPSARGASLKMRDQCKGYVASQFFEDVPPGEKRGDFFSQDLEKQTFEDESFDLVVTQDVFEHIFRPDLAIQEICRTLRPGGAHIMTVPIVNKEKPSVRRASLADGIVTHHAEPEYHGNPVGDGSLVTIDWGFDIADYLTERSGHSTTLFTINDHERGIEAEYIEVVVTRKSPAPAL